MLSPVASDRFRAYYDMRKAEAEDDRQSRKTLVDLIEEKFESVAPDHRTGVPAPRVGIVAKRAPKPNPTLLYRIISTAPEGLRNYLKSLGANSDTLDYRVAFHLAEISHDAFISSTGILTLSIESGLKTDPEDGERPEDIITVYRYPSPESAPSAWLGILDNRRNLTMSCHAGNVTAI